MDIGCGHHSKTVVRTPARRHGGSRGAKAWVPVQTQAEREREEADRANLQTRGMGGSRATLAWERGRVAAEWVEQGASGSGAAATVTEQTGSGSRDCE